MPDGVRSTLPDEGRPPFGSWVCLYAVVAGNLVVLILLFSLFSRVFR